MTSPKLEAMFNNRRTEAQAKRDRHAKRMRELFGAMEATGITFEDFAAAYHDQFVPRAVLEGEWSPEFWSPSYTRRRIFSELRSNLKIAKGKWAKAIAWTCDDCDAMRAEAEREFQDECDAEARSRRGLISTMRQAIA